MSFGLYDLYRSSNDEDLTRLDHSPSILTLNQIDDRQSLFDRTDDDESCFLIYRLTYRKLSLKAPNSRITISNPIFTARGELVYKTTDNTPYDLAVIRIDPKEISKLRSMPISNAIVNKSELIVHRKRPDYEIFVTFFKKSVPNPQKTDPKKSSPFFLIPFPFFLR